MGITTVFWGSVAIDPPLNGAEVAYLGRFAGTRRTSSTLGPYFVDRPGFMGQDHTPDIIDPNRPVDGQPSLFCQWVPTAGGDALRWDEGEKFYESSAWLQYLIDHFLRPGAHAALAGDPQFGGFTFDHRVDGHVFALAQPEAAMFDAYRIDVADNVVTVFDYAIPELELDDEWWDVVLDDVDVSWHIEQAAEGRLDGVQALAADLALLEELGQHDTVNGLRAFLADLGITTPDDPSAPRSTP